jgi:AraC family transcriptional regulator
MDCPYCSIAKKKGELYCSRHATDMRSLKSGLFYIEGKTLEECDWHITRLSLNFNLDGQQLYFTGSKTYTVSPEKYLILSEGESFKTALNSTITNRMLTVAFQVGKADEIINNITQSTDQLLENVNIKGHHTHFSMDGKSCLCDDTISHKATKLSAMTTHDNDEQCLDDELEQLLAYVITSHRIVQAKALPAIEKIKLSTRLEIMKRLNIALEYMQSNFDRTITLDEVAAAACLSTFHFKRLFKDAFRLPPYQYLKSIRMDKAKELLCREEMSVQEVCKAVGWGDTSSFIRLFKKENFITPHQYKHRSRG